MQKIHFSGVKWVKKLINSGQVDKTSDWGFSASDGNTILGPDGNNWDTYGKYHLVEDSEFPEDTKAHWKYPFGKDGKVYRSGVIAVKSRAAQQGFEDLVDVADELLTMIDEDEETGDACGKEKKKDSVIGIRRVDYMPFYDEGPDGSWMTQKMRPTDEGFLKGRAIITNVGVFPYVLDDGSLRWELRPHEEVFAQDSIESLNSVPLTNDHPDVWVNSENAKDLSVGFVGSSVHEDQLHLSNIITITDKMAVSDVLSGKRALSAGYTADWDATPGTWCGVPYDGVQRNIRYNHVAIVPKGRAGDAAKMKLDRMDSAGVQKIEQEDNSMKKIIIDGVEYQGDEGLINKYLDAKKSAETTTQEIEKARADSAKIEAERDALKVKADQLEAETKNMIKKDEVDVIIAKREVMANACTLAGVEKKDGVSERDLMVSVIRSAEKNDSLDLSKKSEEYVMARFDMALETLETARKNDAGQNNFRKDFQDSGDGAKTADKVKHDFWENLKNRSHGKEAK